jgi:ABC-type glycerol-3-phosphate transport system substrate-binding protein
VQGGTAAALPWLAACGAQEGGAQHGGDRSGGQPAEVTWVSRSPGAVREPLWNETFRALEAATGVKVNVIWEVVPNDLAYLEKRSAEAASGSVGADLMMNWVGWLGTGASAGWWADLGAPLKRDKIDTRQFFKADLDAATWKGKLYALNFQSGGDAVIINKRLFAQQGVPLPAKTWTFEDLLATAQKFARPDENTFGLSLGATGFNYSLGTFIKNFGGRLLNDAKDRALFADDNNAVRAAELYFDLPNKYQVVPSAAARQTLPPGKLDTEAGMVAMEVNSLSRAPSIRDAVGREHVDYVALPKGPGAQGTQTASMYGTSWSIMRVSKQRDDAWRALKWLYTRDALTTTPLLKAVSWPAVIWGQDLPEWQEQFRGTRVAEATRVWETGGWDQSVPEGDAAWRAMNAPVAKAIRGEVGARDALREAATAVNELFNQRPANLK